MNKTAIITGASSGIGGAVALALGNAGYSLILSGRDQGKLETLRRQIASSVSCTIISADMSTREGIEGLVKAITIDCPKVDVLVNAAAIWHGEDEVFAGKDLETFPEQVVIDTMMVGIMTPILLSRALIPLLSSGGKIINLTGTFENGGKGWIPYFVSKRALEDLTVALADELKDRGIQVNAFSPSDTATAQYQKYFPQYMDEAIAPENIAKEVLRLCSPVGNSITGQVFVIKKDQPTTPKFHA